MEFNKEIFEKSIDIVIFGATGDLAHRKLFPSLYNLYTDSSFKDKFNIIALGRIDSSNSDFTSRFNDTIPQKKERDDFYNRIKYFKCDFTKKSELIRLKVELDKVCNSRIFYLALPPAIYNETISSLIDTGLNIPCKEHSTFTRIILEKPFGHNLESSIELNKTILSGFSEKQIFRIDHYLGKEPVQNIFSFRFANNIFENIWNKDYIDNIQIKVLEDMGVEDRGAFYDANGALIDVFQNHILQILSILTMEKPHEFKEEYIREEKNNILKSIIYESSLKAQYKGYKEENNVSSESKRETFIALKLKIQNDRWSSIPIYVQTGKYLNEKRTEISVIFKKNGSRLFKGSNKPNILKFLIQPDLGIELNLLGKIPSVSDYILSDIDMLYKYSDYFGELKSEYEKLLIDCILGNQINFTRSDEIENAWRLVDKIENDIKNISPIIYEPRSKGPSNLDEFIKKDSRNWE
jgi:glucose-6-phosphate 1-dehydrogenase